MNTRNQYWQTMTKGERLYSEKKHSSKQDNRSAFDMDHDRIVYSNFFRRMHDKTQVFPYSPLSTSSQARSRLSHSLEVSCVGRSLGNLTGKFLTEHNIAIDPYDIGTIIASACLAHDIGNPPFGHAGEDSIQEWARSNLPDILSDRWEEHDILHFEGNAQGFRILTRLEAWHRKGGLRPTLATLGAFTKYPCASIKTDPKSQNVALKKYGFFKEDCKAFQECMHNFAFSATDHDQISFPRHPFSFLSEAADDICYAVIDLEDAYHLGLLSFKEIYDLLYPIAAQDHNFEDDADSEPENRLARLRSSSINSLIIQCIEVFKQNIEKIEEFSYHTSLISEIRNRTEYEAIKEFSMERIYTTHRVLEIECAGFKAIGGLLHIFIPAILATTPNKEENVYRKLIPPIYFKRFEHAKHYKQQHASIAALLEPLSAYQRILSITDYIASMTDRYAIELYQRLSGIKLPVY